MLQFSVYTIPRPPLFEIKANISFKKAAGLQKEKEVFVTVDQLGSASTITNEQLAKLDLMRIKLEQIVPPAYKTKYRVSNEQLVATTMTHLADQARRIAQNMEDYIHAAAHELKLK